MRDLGEGPTQGREEGGTRGPATPAIHGGALTILDPGFRSRGGIAMVLKLQWEKFAFLWRFFFHPASVHIQWHEDAVSRISVSSTG